jgi:Na+-translocating ferredoxin:NAD+ oxidoreductase subunit C
MPARPAFPAGLALAAHKRQATGLPIVELAPPAQVVLALDQGSGSTAQPVVAVGARVAIGTLVARADDAAATAIHAPIAGIVIAIEARAAAAEGGHGVCIVIEGDGTATLDASVRPIPDLDTLDPAELMHRLRDAGIAGLGGAAFPTATKLAAARASGAQLLLLNGAECEPWICCDDVLMRSSAAEVVLGARILQHALGAARCVIAVEDDKPEAIAALRAALEGQDGAALSVAVVPAVYPQGAERQLVTAVTGIEVPSGDLPAQAGVLCQNVATAAAVARWARDGEPAMARIVTVTGSGVARPCNVRALLGTPLAALIDAAGGYQGKPLRLIAGGSMTGRALASDEAGLTKAMNCILVATSEDLGGSLDRSELPCIRCGDCAAVCPVGLLPQMLHRATLADDQQSMRQLGAHDCIDCGLCDYVCPSQIPLASRFRAARRTLRIADESARRANAAKVSYERREQRLRATAAAEQQALDAARSRAGQDRDAAAGRAGGAD